MIKFNSISLLSFPTPLARFLMRFRIRSLIELPIHGMTKIAKFRGKQSKMLLMKSLSSRISIYTKILSRGRKGHILIKDRIIFSTFLKSRPKKFCGMQLFVKPKIIILSPWITAKTILRSCMALRTLWASP